MKSFRRIKNVHGKQYLYEITPYYDRERKKIRQKSKYIAPIMDGKTVERYAVTYTYGDLLPVIRAARDLKLPDILRKIAGEYADTLMIMAINRVIRPEAMDLIQEWYDDSYISTVYAADMSSAALSRAMTAIGKMNLNHAFLNEIIKVMGISGALYYDLTSHSSQSRNIDFLEYGYSRSDPDYPQVNVSLVESSESGIPIFYDIYPGSVNDITTVKNTIDVLRSAGLADVTFIMDRGMFSSSTIVYLIESGMDFIMPASYTLKEIRRLALSSRKTVEKAGNMISMSGEIMFAVKRDIRIGNTDVSAWVYYDPERDSRERTVFYSSLKERMDRFSTRTVRKWEKPGDVCDDIMGPYRNFISFRYDGSFHIRIRDNAVSQRVNRCGITVITFTGDHDSEYVLSEYRKRDAVEKLFMSSKTFTGGEPLRVHGMDALRGEMFVNLIAIAIRSRILEYMRSSGLLKKYSVEKMLLELHKLRKVILNEGKEITTEITRKQKEILESIGIKPEHVPTFLKR
ncbi:IS1634 family transposase [Cuniculiplasma sp. SKW4]|uniref:IS1634 family transposase n=1 Tax=Cuniculiplasma sp. SKW4 TaxID=3400171 RepID=UPI003FD3D5B2